VAGIHHISSAGCNGQTKPVLYDENKRYLHVRVCLQIAVTFEPALTEMTLSDGVVGFGEPLQAIEVDDTSWMGSAKSDIMHHGQRLKSVERQHTPSYVGSLIPYPTAITESVSSLTRTILLLGHKYHWFSPQLRAERKWYEPQPSRTGHRQSRLWKVSLSTKRLHEHKK
jgi:hypothetical protein